MKIITIEEEAWKQLNAHAVQTSEDCMQELMAKGQELHRKREKNQVRK